MWSRRSAIERCPSPRNQIRFCPIVTDNGQVKGTDILLIQILCSKIWKSVNIIALHWPVICYYWAKMYLVSWRRASLDRRSTTPQLLTAQTGDLYYNIGRQDFGNFVPESAKSGTEKLTGTTRGLDWHSILYLLIENQAVRQNQNL